MSNSSPVSHLPTSGQPWVMFENNRANSTDNQGLLFAECVRQISCNDPLAFNICLTEMEQALDSGYYLAGWFSYECAYLLEPRLRPLFRQPGSQPLLWFGVFKHPTELDYSAREILWSKTRDYQISQFESRLAQTEYLQAFNKIKNYISAGDVYQINYTFKFDYQLQGDRRAFYRDLRNSQAAEYSAYIETPDWTVLGLSPELFLQKKAEKLRCQPMKGTAKRSAQLKDDLEARKTLQRDEKTRAENLMIVDLLRNDLGRLAIPGSVKVSDLFRVSAYQTLLQMTSTIEAELATEPSLVTWLKGLFPCGSVTGAPKIRAMEIIHELEPNSRGLYTGALGYITPQRDFVFNVPIRTLVVDQLGHGELAVGSAIVNDSNAEDEYNECFLKAKFAINPTTAFQLIETLRLDASGDYFLLQEHLTRLQQSAEYFDYPFDRQKIELKFTKQANQLKPNQAYRIRLLLSNNGKIVLEPTPLQEQDTTAPATSLPNIFLSKQTSDSQQIFLYHKTTNRQLYETEYQSASAEGYYDVLFCNEQGNLTETTRYNLFLEKDGQLFTPELQCGLLPGTMRQSLLASGKARTARLSLTDLQNADKIFLANSVRGLVQVSFKSNTS